MHDNLWKGRSQGVILGRRISNLNTTKACNSWQYGEFGIGKDFVEVFD